MVNIKEVVGGSREIVLQETSMANYETRETLSRARQERLNQKVFRSSLELLAKGA